MVLFGMMLLVDECQNEDPGPLPGLRLVILLFFSFFCEMFQMKRPIAELHPNKDDARIL